MKIGVVGAGYVGLVTAACFARDSHEVVCMDTDAKKIVGLESGILPFFEVGLARLIQRAGDNLRFTLDHKALSDADVVFLCVGTPQNPDGSADLGHIYEAADRVAAVIRKDAVIAIKSTVPPGTAKAVRDRLRTCYVASNPEFLREGSAVSDCQDPDRIVIGTDDAPSALRLTALYRDWSDQVICMTTHSAELVKYGTNGMLAVRISLMNELADLAGAVGADIKSVEKGIGSDRRIGPEFLEAGIGYGGSCFPKDLQVLMALGREMKEPQTILAAAEEVNQRRQLWPYLRMLYSLPFLWGRQVAIWGLSFKPGTDDIRNAASVPVIKELLLMGASVAVYDPLVEAPIHEEFGEQIRYCENPIDAARDASALAVLTKDEEFIHVSLDRLREVMADPALVVDGRNIWHPDEMRQRGFQHICVGRQ